MSHIFKKRSFGLACCRFNPDNHKVEILMIKKRYTYAFFEFVFGRYNKSDESKIRNIFDRMTFQEKRDILKMNFDILWKRLLINIPNPPDGIQKHKQRKVRINNGWTHYMKNNGFDQTDSSDWNCYNRKKNKFNKLIADHGKQLYKLINNTQTKEPLWEIPKGRPIHGELPLNTAIREFTEETGVTSDKYYMCQDIKPIFYSYHKNRCDYRIGYYVVIAKKNNWTPRINFTSYEQSIEVDNIKWVPEDEIAILTKDQINHKNTMNAVKLISKAVKKYKPVTSRYGINISSIRKINHKRRKQTNLLHTDDEEKVM